MSAAVILSLMIFLMACVVGVGTIWVYSVTAPYQDAFLPGTMLLGYPLSGASMEDAQALLERITREDIDGFSVELTWGNQSYVLSGKDLQLSVDSEATLAPLWSVGHDGGMIARFVEIIRLRSEPMAAVPIVTYDMTAADELLLLIEQDIVCQPEDAKVVFTPGSAQPFAFETESIGYSLDLAPIRVQIERAAASVEPAVIALDPKEILPAFTREELEEATVLRSRELIAIDADEATLANVKLAASALDGTQIAPGKTLSFNETVGMRSAERGYLVAAEPAYGENVSGVGGGICRASTALYRAALLGGLAVSERSAAVYPVDCCPIGQEAAVSDQGIDLVIENTTAYPVFLRVRVYEDAGKTMLDMQIIGQPLSGGYELVSSVTDETLITEPVYVRDHEGRYAIYDDERVEGGEAKPGYTVLVERIALDKEGNEFSRENISNETYEPIPPAIYIGVQSR